MILKIVECYNLFTIMLFIVGGKETEHWPHSVM